MQTNQDTSDWQFGPLVAFICMALRLVIVGAVMGTVLVFSKLAGLPNSPIGFLVLFAAGLGLFLGMLLKVRP